MARRLHSKKTFRLGKGFGDSVDQKKSSFVPSVPKISLTHSNRIYLFLLFFIGFSILSGKLFMLTIVEGSYYRSLGDSNRIREERIPAKRGVLYDRNGIILAENRPIYKKCEQASFSCTVISREKALEREVAGKEVTFTLGREYLYGPLLAHTLGYMSEVSQQQLESENRKIMSKYGYSKDQFCYECYGLGDFIGATGLEAVLEDRLRGTPGKRLVEVDSVGKQVRELARIEPVSGENIYLSIDLTLQAKAVSALEKMRMSDGVDSPGGTVVATDPKTGEILALYSSPTYDPNAFVGAVPWDKVAYSPLVDENIKKIKFHDVLSENVDEIIEDEKKPMFNRVIGGLYPPGSTFKIITATAGLEEGVIDKDTLIEDTGVLTIGQYSYGNWYFNQYGRTEGKVAIVKAIARSNDIYFYKVGEMLKIDKLENWARKFKTEDVIDIGLKGEVAGAIRRARDWYLGDTYHIAIGQGDMQVTPLHVNEWMQIIADDGKYCKPTLITDPKSEERNSKRNCENIGISDSTLSLVKQGLEEACSTGGTAWPLFNFGIGDSPVGTSSASFKASNFKPIKLACKTGTAEFGDPDNKTHAWLTAYGPSDKPEIVVTVLLEEGGEGSSNAGPVVRDVMKGWFEDAAE